MLRRGVGVAFGVGELLREVVRALKREPREVEASVSLDVEDVERVSEYAMSDEAVGRRR
jgi:hypothetical protein